MVSSRLTGFAVQFGTQACLGGLSLVPLSVRAGTQVFGQSAQESRQAVSASAASVAFPLLLRGRLSSDDAWCAEDRVAKWHPVEIPAGTQLRTDLVLLREWLDTKGRYLVESPSSAASRHAGKEFQELSRSLKERPIRSILEGGDATEPRYLHALAMGMIRRSIPTWTPHLSPSAARSLHSVGVHLRELGVEGVPADVLEELRKHASEPASGQSRGMTEGPARVFWLSSLILLKAGAIPRGWGQLAVALCQGAVQYLSQRWHHDAAAMAQEFWQSVAIAGRRGEAGNVPRLPVAASWMDAIRSFPDDAADPVRILQGLVAAVARGGWSNAEILFGEAAAADLKAGRKREAGLNAMRKAQAMLFKRVDAGVDFTRQDWIAMAKALESAISLLEQGEPKNASLVSSLFDLWREARGEDVPRG